MTLETHQAIEAPAGEETSVEVHPERSVFARAVAASTAGMMNERSMFADGVLLLVVVFVLSRVLIEERMKERMVAFLTVKSTEDDRSRKPWPLYVNLSSEMLSHSHTRLTGFYCGACINQFRVGVNRQS